MEYASSDTAIPGDLRMALIAATSAAFFLFTVSLYVIGHAGFTLFFPNEAIKNIWIRYFLSMNLGLSVVITIMVALGAVNFFSFWTVAGTLLITIVSAGILLLAKRKSFSWKNDAQPLAVLFVLLCFGISVSIHPVGLWDDTMYHLPLVRHYLEQAGFACAETLRFPLFPQNMDVLFGLGFLLYGTNTAYGEMFIQLLATFPLLLTMFGITAASSRYIGTICPGFLGTVILLFLKPITIVLGFAYIDYGMMLFCWSALLCLALSIDSAEESERRCLLVLAGFFSGMAMGTKYFGLVSIGLSGLFYLCVTRNFCSTFWYGVITLTVGSWWYIRAWLISGDPFHPAGGQYVGYFLWNAQDLLLQTAEQGMHGVEKNIINIWPALQKAGVGILVMTPLIVFRWKRLPTGVKLIAFSSIAYFFFWFFVTQVERYIQPALPPLVFLIVYSIWTLLARRRELSKCCQILVIGLSAVVLVYSIYERKNELDNWERYQYPKESIALMDRANELSPQYGRKLLQLGFENLIYYFHGTAFGDHFGRFRYRDFLENSLVIGNNFSVKTYLNYLRETPLISPKVMFDTMKKQNCRMLAINTDIFRFDLNLYQTYFIIQERTPHGLLLTIKDGEIPSPR